MQRVTHQSEQDKIRGLGSGVTQGNSMPTLAAGNVSHWELGQRGLKGVLTNEKDNLKKDYAAFYSVARPSGKLKEMFVQKFS